MKDDECDAPAPPKPEAVDHPDHYNHGSIEVIDVIEDWGLGFHAASALKYIARYRHKGRPVEDLKKCAWYVNRLIGVEEGNRLDPGMTRERLSKANDDLIDIIRAMCRQMADVALASEELGFYAMGRKIREGMDAIYMQAEDDGLRHARSSGDPRPKG